MSKRFNEINGKDVNEFNETEENRNIKRKTELDINLIHFYIGSEAGCHVNRPPKMVELSPSQLDTYLSKYISGGHKEEKRRRLRTNYSYRFRVLCSVTGTRNSCAYSFYIALSWTASIT